MSDPNTPAPFYFEPTRQSPLAILIILVKLIRALIGQLWPVLVVIFLGRSNDNSNRNLVILWLMVGVGIFSMARAFLIFFRTRFYVQDDEFILEKGGFTRRRLSIPLDKIQTITFQQTFLHRLFDLVSIDMDTSGGKGSEVSINAFNRKKANELRDYLLLWKKENPAPASEENQVILEKTPHKTLLQLGFGDLMRIGLSQNHLRSAGILIGLVFSFAGDIQPILGQSTYVYLKEELGLSFDFFWAIAIWLVVFFLIVSVFATLILTIVRFYGLRFVQTGDGFRLEAGLFTRREQAAYLPKIQFLRWSANPLQRFLGLSNLRFYQAVGHELSGKQTIQVPGCYHHHIASVREAYFPGSGELAWSWHTPHRFYFLRRVAWIGGLPLVGLIVKTSLDFSGYWLLVCLLWFPVTAWWQWKLFRGKHYGLSTKGLWVKSGFFNAVQTLLQWQHVQAVAVQQSLSEARFQLVDVVFYTASGVVTIECLPDAIGNELRDYVLA
ncbi:MAG: PH domain-containing protein, partial [Saprospiraceae bacterium]|nr:PH domain-containing protein [Saprospiraceae bacterium]